MPTVVLLTYRPYTSLYERGHLCPKENMVCQANIPGNGTVDMFLTFYLMFFFSFLKFCFIIFYHDF